MLKNKEVDFELLISETVMVRWCPKNREHYESKGYIFTKNRDELEVKVEDLLLNSNVKVKILCDYCNNEYETKWSNYNLSHSKCILKKDCCKNCINIKRSESIMFKYNVKSIFMLPETKQKIINTNIKRYGVENPLMREEIKNKIKETNLKKYGVEYYSQTEESKNRVENTCLEKYGVANPLKNEDVYNKMKQTNLTKHGVENYAQTDEYKQKYKETCMKKYGATSHMKTDKYKKMVTGENSGRWNFNLTNEERIKNRDTIDNANWRNYVFHRDNYICQCCGSSASGNLNAHHLDGYNWCKDRRTDLNNGITLCEDCHKDFHHIYGYGNNTEQQFNEWFSSKVGEKVAINI